MMDEVVRVKKEKQERDSNMELLRIISILMIILYHVCRHGKWTNLALYTPDSFILNCLTFGGKVGVTCFVLISGYYLILSEKSNYIKIVKLWISVLFYSVVISLFFFIEYDYPYDSLTIFKMITPIMNETWWFMSAFIILMIISPLLNKIAHSIDKRTYLSMIMIFTILWFIVPTITGSTTYGLNNVLQFSYLYLIAGFIRLYPESFGKRTFLYCGIFIVSLATTCGSYYVLEHINSNDPLIFTLTANYMRFVLGYSVTVLLMSLSLFLLLNNTKHFSCKPINILASATLGVYLIHEQPYVRDVIYNDFFHCTEHFGSPDMVPYCLFVMIGIYCICVPIELARLYLLEKPFMKIITPHLENIHRKYLSFVVCLSEKI